MNLFDAIVNNFNSVITVVAAGGAYCVYYIEKRAHKMQAAKIIVMDIRIIETVVIRLKSKRPLDFMDNKLNYDNSWEKYKHLFISDMSPDSFSKISSLFTVSDELKSAFELSDRIFNETLFEKSRIMQQQILGSNRTEDVSTIANRINREVEMFSPSRTNYLIDRFKDSAQIISGSVAFETLRKIAKMN